MTQPNKLYRNLLSNPRTPIAFRDFEKLLRAFGFEHVRTRGSHAIWNHPKLVRPFPIQPTGKDAKLYQVREFLELVEGNGLYMKP
ncbi:MAG: type II toxin-antitoxin system HicA family toxin [Erythrobacter sp.]|nr:type II toxin-antitoxin system HicA family toxin [Erythrobacter sp.]